MAKLIVGDTLAILRVTVKDAGTVVNLTGATVLMNYRINGGTLVTTTNWTISNPTTGVCDYQFTSGELTAGQLVGELQITISGKVGKTSKLYIDIEAAV